MSAEPLAPEAREAFTTAATLALQELMQTEALPAGESRPLGAEVFAEIDLRRAVPGTLVLAFPWGTLTALAGRYLPGEELTEEILEDTAGELANVIAGQAKTMLKGTPWHFLLSTPRSGRTSRPQAGEALRLDTDAGPFWLSIHLPACPGA
jgi:CheY-specific phosphatase CheX